MFFKKKKNPYDDALDELNDLSTKAADRIIFEKMVDNDEFAKNLVESLKDGYPLVINFKDLDEFQANKMLSFLIGATLALDGRTVKINSFTFLFAKKADFLDGSLKQFIDSVAKK